MDVENSLGDANFDSLRIGSVPSTLSFVRRMGLLALTILLVTGNAGLASSELSTEYKVKAAFLYNFTKFIDWPKASSGAERKSIHLCIHGDNPFGSMLAASVKGRTVRGKNIQVREVDVDDLSSCDLLFISSSEKQHVEVLLADLPAKGILTVADHSGFLSAGGGIELVIDRGKVRFRINLAMVNRAELSVDSRLLALATEVLKGGGAAR
ncbi:MAG: YfiR family protein [Myxococcales bacterium]|nr:YfiR family protein [Myxococcales bacterium]